MPEVLDRLDLGEESGDPDVEAPAVALDRLADAPHHVGRLGDNDRLPAFMSW